jgi:xylulokinase
VGELTPYANPKLRGGFTFVGAEHTKAHFARSVMEGVALSLLDCKKYLEGKGVEVGKTAYIIGGGAKSAVWRQIVADTLGITLIQTKYNDSSFGSAMCAGIAVGYYRDFVEASKTCNQEIGRVEPIWENTQKYAKIFKKYKKISQVLAELCDEE